MDMKTFTKYNTTVMPYTGGFLDIRILRLSIHLPEWNTIHRIDKYFGGHPSNITNWGNGLSEASKLVTD